MYIEIILIDDGSTDNSFKIYQKYPQILHKSVSCDSLWQKKEREDLLKKIENDNNEKQSSFKDNISKFSPFGSRLDKFSKISNYVKIKSWFR